MSLTDQDQDDGAELAPADQADAKYQQEFDENTYDMRMIRTALKVLEAAPEIFLVEHADQQKPISLYNATDVQMQRRIMVATDQMRIAAADRITRILNSDLD